MKRTPFKRKATKPMKRTKLRVKGVSETATLKEEIQDLVREIVIKRDGGCIFRDVYGVPQCNGYRKDGELILQADHLITRGNSATYADTRLVVCACKGHHGWKKYHKEQYDSVVRTLLSKDRVELWERCEQDRWRPTPKRSSDWKLHILALKQELAKMK